MTALTTDFSGLLYYNPAGPGFNPVESATLNLVNTGPINEGDQVNFEIITWGIPDGTTLYYRIVGLSNMNYNQFTDVNDSVVITNHRGYFSVGIFENNLTAAGTQTFDIVIEKTFGGGGELTRIAGIVVNDTSQSAPASLAFVIGSANYKEVAGTTSNWALSTTWTIEFWSNCAQASSSAPITIMSQAIGGGAIDIHYLSGSLTVNNDRVLCDEPTAGIWTHVALVCDGGNGLTVYYNGVSVYTGSAYGLSNNSDTLVIGKRAQNNFQYFTGHLAGIRITNTAVYTSSFNPLTAALPPAKIAGTRLLINSTVGASVVDASDSAHTLVNGSVTISEYYPPTIQLTSGSSLAFNGTDNRHVVVSGDQWNWNLGANWCIEWWQKIPVAVDGFFSILCQDANIDPYTGIDVFVHDGKIKLFNGNMMFYESPRAPRGRWNHIAVQKDGTTVKAFINGYRVEVLSTGGFSGTIAPSSPLNLVIGSRTADGGATFWSGQRFNGELSNIRISNADRYYTDIFTPPTVAQFDVYGVAVLALDGSTYGMLDDVSANNHTITNNGAVVTAIGPYSRSFGTQAPSPQVAMIFDIGVFPFSVIGWTMTGPGITQTTTVTGQTTVGNQTSVNFTPAFTYSPGTYVFTPP